MKWWQLIKLHLRHALKYKPYHLHDTVIISHDYSIHYFRRITFSGFIQHYHFIAKNNKSGTCISSYDKAYYSEEKVIWHIQKQQKKGS